MAEKSTGTSTRSDLQTPSLVSRRLWIVAAFATLVMLVGGMYVRNMLTEIFHENVRDNLETILQTNVLALSSWLESRGDWAEIAAADPQIHGAIVDLEAISARPGAVGEELKRASQQSALRQEIPAIVGQDFKGYVVVDRRLRVIASDQEALIGRTLDGYEQQIFEHCFQRRGSDSESLVTNPFRPDELRPEPMAPTMFAIAPVAGSGLTKTTVAALGLRLDPAEKFNAILEIGQTGRTGETYAFNQDGLMLSSSRFDTQLQRIQVLPKVAGLKSPLNVQVRDPGANLLLGETPIERTKQKLTLMAQSAIETRQPSSNVEGYRDYRGVPVVGAWTWLPEHNFGVATEIDEYEAYKPLNTVLGIFWSLFALLGLGAACIVPIGWFLDRVELRARRATLEAKRLGQYTLKEKIGEGGMGAVYKAQHALLRRPTAVKLLDPDRTNDATIARFEREVLLTSQLNHPNTIAIFDFGRTPDGMFYYAMEYLDGIDLERLVAKHGRLSEGRTVFILKQICASLREAHAVGLIHRDIKPANIMLNKRGGQFDVVKVLDFGLVKAAGSQNDSGVTLNGAILGTPNYVSPESINDPELVGTRSDLYAVGAVAYFLLTGSPVFDGESALEVCVAHVNKAPMPPSKRLGRAVSVDLERLIMSCLEKRPENRPPTAAAMLDELAECTVDAVWSVEDAAAWWAANPVRFGGSSTMPRTDEIHIAETVIDLTQKRL